MAGKKKKEKKNVEVNKESISAVDQTFYEVTITDLNTKLAHLRAHNAKLEQRNEELEAEMAQLTEDRADVTAFLNRSLHSQASSIKDLEEKLSELSKVRQEETEHFQGIIKSWEQKYKAMNDQLSSEIKLLNGKLNSLEEFRIQKDELMAKYDQQESDAKEQQHRHKTVLYEMERKQIIDKDRLKKEVEGKLIQLSNEFRKSNEVRIATHVQRLVRENIALNNELDRLLVTHRRMEKEMQAILTRQAANRTMSRTILAENSELARMCHKYLRTARELSDEVRSFREQKQIVEETEAMRKLAETREIGVRRELHDSRARLQTLERDLDTQRTDCQALSARADESGRTAQALLDALKQVKHAIVAAVQFDEASAEASARLDDVDEHDNDESNDDERRQSSMLTFNEVERKNVLLELERILVQVKDFTPSTNDQPTMLGRETSTKTLYRKGTIGILPRLLSSNAFRYSRQSYRNIAAANMPLDTLAVTPETLLDVCELIDVGNVSDTRMSMAESAGSTELLRD